MLKNLLALLLAKFYSKEESSLVAHQAMPSDQPVNIASKTTISSWGTIATFTAPGDGYVTFHGRSMAGAAAQIASLPLENNPTVITATQDNYQGMACNLPVQKGKTVEIYGSNIENIVVSFNRLIGGVSALKKFILQGGVLCRLSRLCNSLRRSFCRVRRNGSEVKVFSQTQIPEQRSLLTTLRLNFIRLQVMDGLHSAETGHRSMSALPESWERVALTLKVISELQLRFGRGIPLVSIARRTISNRLRQNSFPAKGQRNTSLVGGASC